MGNAFAVTILECYEDLSEDAARLLLVKLLVDHFFQVRVEAATFDVFHDEVDVRVRLKGLNQLDDVRVVHFLQQYHLAANTPLAIDI